MPRPFIAIVAAAAFLSIVAPTGAGAQGIPEYAQGISPVQWNTFKAAQASLQKRLNLSEAMLASISRIVGKGYRTRGFLGVLQDLKDSAELAAKLQGDVASLRAQVKLLPAGSIRTDAEALLVEARADLEAGRLELAETKLTSLANLRWAKSGADLAIWLQATIAQSDVVRIRIGPEAAAKVLGDARAGLLASTAKLGAELLLREAAIFQWEHESRGTREPLDRALAILDGGLKSVDFQANRAEYGRIQLAITQVTIRLAAWDASFNKRVTEAYAEAAKFVSPGDTDDYLSLQYLLSESEMASDRGDAAIARMDAVLKQTDLDWTPARRMMAQYQLARMRSARADQLKSNSAERAALYRAAIADNEAAIKTAQAGGLPFPSAQINGLSYKMSLAVCCVPVPRKFQEMQEAITQIVKAESFWSKSESPASWYHVQTIIGGYFREIAAERYNHAILVNDVPAMETALDEMRTARRYYLSGLAFMTENNVGSGRAKFESELGVIDSNIAVMERRLGSRTPASAP